MRRLFRLIAVLTALAVAGCTVPRTTWVDGTGSAAPGASANPSGQAVAWKDCAEEVREFLGLVPSGLTFECGTIKVPQDWSTAKNGEAGDGKTFDIALLRARSKRQADRIGSLVINPGGPGGSGVEYAALGTGYFSEEITRRFDIVGFDPRGVGRSSPVKCFSDADLDASFGYDPDPVSQTDFNNVVGLTRRMVTACGTKYGETLRLYSTEQAARDIDAIRAAVGDQRLTYLGFSYGTLLGATYAQLFPTHIRAMVLDGAVDPQQNAVAATEGNARGFERAFDNFATWCKENTTRCPIAPDARAAVTNAINAARTGPVRDSSGRVATAGWVFTAVVSSLYVKDYWPELASAIDGLRKGDPKAMFRLADAYADRSSDGKFSNLFDANNAVNCTDGDQFPTVEAIRTLQGDWRVKYPLFGAPFALGLVGCSLWPGKRDPYPVGQAKGAPPIVVVGTTGDPATPYEQTAKLAEMLGVGRVITSQGEGHTAYPEVRCVRDVVDRYLIDLVAPASDPNCPPE